MVCENSCLERSCTGLQLRKMQQLPTLLHSYIQQRTYTLQHWFCHSHLFFFFPSALLFWENLKSTAEESCQQQQHCISSGYLQPGSQYVTLTQSDLARKERGYLRSKRESKQGENTFSLVSCQILLSVSLEK